MKKLIVVFICLMLSAAMVACGMNTQPKNESSAGADENSGKKLTDMLDEICDGVDVPAYDVFELDNSDFEAFSFAPWSDGVEAACSEGQITTMAHSLVLIRMNEGGTEKMAKAIAEKADMRKWVCVEAETGAVLYTDNYILMVMTYKDAYDGLKANFEKLMGTDTVNILTIKSSEQNG